MLRGYAMRPSCCGTTEVGSRNPNRASTVYLGSDGSWHGRVTVGFADDGSLDRRHVRGQSKGVVVQKVRDLEKPRDQGRVSRVGQRWTVASWLEHWLENIARPDLRPTSYVAYRNAVRTHLIPRAGKHRLDRLEPEHLERLYRQMILDGSKPATAHQVHRTVRTALGEAQRRGHVSRNAAALAKPPRVEVEPLTVEEVRSILTTAELGPNRARWAIALALGLRQGEVLGLVGPILILSPVCCGCAGLACARSTSTGAAAAAGSSRAGVLSGSWSTARMATRSRGRAGARLVFLKPWPGCLSSTGSSKRKCVIGLVSCGRRATACSRRRSVNR